jgi:hypothetical protein
MKQIGWAVAGLGLFGLLVLGRPAHAQGTSGTGSSTSGQSSGSMGSSRSTDSTTSGSSTTSPGTSMGMEKSSSSGSVSGKVKTFDKSANELTLANSDKTLKLSDKTKVTKNGQQASTSDIHEGDQVRASFSGTGSNVDVLMIDIVPAEATPPAK